ncbi:hypothetical protein [Idiomarina xiamenensis]|nr:hypothetical protein [Idiomarina xiamenensis]
MQSEPTKRSYNYNSSIYLDVAVPVFNPGFPIDADSGHIDYDELGEMDIWPQLRRAEAKRFAIQTKHALQDTKAFGSVNNVPSTDTTADLFVLGTINHSDSEVVTITVMVIDSAGTILGEREFEHTVSQYFFRDQQNQDKNPYEPVFSQIGDYVYDLVTQLPDTQKQRIKQTTLVRYAQYYSPEAYDSYVSRQLKRYDGQQYYQYSLNGLPAEDDPMFQRIQNLRAQDLLFVDRMQDQFEVFDKETEDAYRQWQKETLPEAVRAREARAERNTKAALGIGLGVLAAVLGNNSSSTATAVARTAGAIGSVWLLKDAYKANENLKVARTVIDEMGQGLDLNLSPTVMEFDDKSVELTGTASEQYEQWKAHLRKIYALEQTPDTRL